MTSTAVTSHSDPRHDATAAAAAPVGPSPFGNARALLCRECGSEAPLGPSYACLQCFGPLEVTYHDRRVGRAEIEAGPRSMWRYAPLLPVRPDIASIPSTEPGWTRLVRVERLGRALG